MGTFLLKYGGKYHTTIFPKIAILAIVFVYQMQSSEDSIPNICSLSHFFQQIEDDKMNYDPTEYPKKKII